MERGLVTFAVLAVVIVSLGVLASAELSVDPSKVTFDSKGQEIKVDLAQAKDTTTPTPAPVLTAAETNTCEGCSSEEKDLGCTLSEGVKKCAVNAYTVEGSFSVVKSLENKNEFKILTASDGKAMVTLPGKNAGGFELGASSEYIIRPGERAGYANSPWWSGIFSKKSTSSKTAVAAVRGKENPTLEISPPQEKVGWLSKAKSWIAEKMNRKRSTAVMAVRGKVNPDLEVSTAG